MTATYIHERAADGAKIEYRRNPVRREGILDLQSRVLRPDGCPYDDNWYTVTDEGLLNLQLSGSDILDLIDRR